MGLTNNQKCLGMVAWLIGEAYRDGHAPADQSLAEFARERCQDGWDLDIILGSEGEGHWSRIQDFRVTDDELPAVIAAAERVVGTDPEELYRSGFDASRFTAARQPIHRKGTT